MSSATPATERAAARARLLAAASADSIATEMCAEAIRAHPLVSVAAGLAAGFLAARRKGGVDTLLLITRLWLQRKS